MKLSIIIPCYNEAERIAGTLEKIAVYIQTKQCEAEVIVVDNGSSDDTASIAKSFKDRIGRLNVISKKSYGKGWAVKEGMLAATGDLRLFMDADNSTDISQADKMLPFIDQGYDVVISSRKIEGAIITHPQPAYRELLGRLFSILVSIIIPLGIKDTQNGFKLFTKETAEKIFRRQTSFYWAFDVEILALARKFGFKIKEVPIVWQNDERSRMNLAGMAQMLCEVIVIRLRLWTRDYTKTDQEI